MTRVLQALQMAVIGLRNNILRSLLTVLGIVIGIAAVIAVMAVGNGTQQAVVDNISNLGTDLLTISAGRGSDSKSLSQRDIDYLSVKTRFPYIETISPIVNGGYSLATYEEEESEATVNGVGPSYFEIYPNITLSAGSLVSAEDVSNTTRQVVIGNSVKEDLFGGTFDENVIGKAISLGDQSFVVTGVLAEQEQSGFQDPNASIFMAYTSAATYLGDGSSSFDSVVVGVDEGEHVAQTQAQIEKFLSDYRGLEEADFSIFSPEDILNTVSSVTGTFTLMMAGIASISLLVGGVGISNIMLVSVTERTKEIGLRKAVGARKLDVLWQFLWEAIMLTGAGGLLGILVGYAAAAIYSAVSGSAASVSLINVVMASSISVLIGLAFGFFPARRAANMNPIDALRYE
jgi:putative ABC transport system permease protein